MSKMLEWSSDAARERVPEELRPKIPTAKGRGQFFVGRTDELKLLRERHQRAPEKVVAEAESEEDARDASFITVIHNAPGAGKSTLLDEFSLQHLGRGGHILRLTAEALQSDEHLRQAINQSPAVKCGWALKAAGQGLDVLLTLTGWNLVQGIVKALKMAGNSLHKQLRTPTDARIAMEVAQCEGTVNGIDLIRTLGQATDGGTIIVVDEAQALGEMGDSQTRILLQQLGDPSERVGLELRSGGVILAGLPDTDYRLQQLHKSRAFSMPLSPLRSNDVSTMLEAAWRQGWPEPRGLTPEGKPHELTKETRALIQTLTSDFRSWTHHSYSAAFSMREILRKLHRQADAKDLGKPTPPVAMQELCNWIRTYAALGACQLYDRTARLAAEYVGPDGTGDIVAEINASGTVADATLRRLFDTARKPGGLEEIDRIDDDTAKRRLLHIGLLVRERDKNENLTGRLVMPIPSLQEYLTATGGKAARSLFPHERDEPDVDPEMYFEWTPPESEENQQDPDRDPTNDDK